MFDAEDIALFFARLLLAIMFVVSALDKFRLDPVEMGQISSLHLPAPAALERVTGVFEMVGATALVLGVYARVAAVALALFVAFVSLMFVQFWSFKGPDDARVMVRNLFVGNLTAIGAALCRRGRCRQSCVCGPLRNRRLMDAQGRRDQALSFQTVQSFRGAPSGIGSTSRFDA